jgi:V8-like Glu-specific endopeptidase
MKAARCTALLEVEFRKSDGGIVKGHGTAFFVTEKHLLTAGHNIVADAPGTVRISLRIAYPGVKVYDAGTASTIRTLDCVPLKTLYTKGDKKNKSKDIAILKCEGLNGGPYLPLSSDPLPSNAVVDIIGYPSVGHHDCITRHQNDLNDSEASEASSKILLPTNTLVVTRGTVEKTDVDNGLISYKVSTCHGMSGSCLLYEGKVYGNIPCNDTHSDIRPSSWTLSGFFGREYRDIVHRP